MKRLPNISRRKRRREIQTKWDYQSSVESTKSEAHQQRRKEYVLSQWSYILKLEERPKGEEVEKRGNLSPLEIRNDGRMLDLIHIFRKPVLCTRQPSLHSESVPNTPIYIYCAQNLLRLRKLHFFPTQITFFYANLLPPTFSKENSIRGRHARQMNKLQDSSLNIKIGKVSVERNRTALPGAQDELIVKPKKA